MTIMIKTLFWIVGILADILLVVCALFGMWMETICLFIIVMYIGHRIDTRVK